jgi:protein-tyrosine phosphatase
VYDMHCHILPDVDDGPVNWDGCIALAKRLVEEGVTTVVATPHSYAYRRPYDAFQIMEITEQAQLRFQEIGLPLQILPGTEIRWSEYTLRLLESNRLLCYGNTRTILLETSVQIELSDVVNAIAELQAKGYQIVFAHPEKLEAVQKNPNVLVPLVKDGVAMQITASNLIGINGPLLKSTSERLITHGMGQLIASDAHSADGARRPAMMEGFKMATQLLGSYADCLFVSFPKTILADEPFPAFSPKVIS